MKYCFDVLICYVATTGGELARILQNCLATKGFNALLCDDSRVSEGAPAACVAIYTNGLFDSDSVALLAESLQKGIPVIPVWFNNCKDWKMDKTLPPGLQVLSEIEISTLDFLGTDFNLSIDKAIERFPSVIRESSKKIAEARQSGDWVSVLAEFPEVVKHPDIVKRNIISRLSDIEWAYLIVTQPTLLREDAWALIKTNSYVWRILICFGFSSEMVPIDCNWRCLTGYDWLAILIVHPQLATHKPWRKFSSIQWIKLLTFRPEFASYYDFREKLGHDIDHEQYEREYSQFPCPLSALILRHPEFAKKCNIDLLSGKCLANLLVAVPAVVDFCNLEKLDGTSWSQLLSVRPELASRCQWEKLDQETIINPGNDWISLLDKQPQFSDRCPWSNFTTQAWIKLLIKHPEYGFRRDWSIKLDEKDRVGMEWDPTLKDLLLAHPEFADRCELSSLTGKDWGNLIFAHPELQSYCDINTIPVVEAMELLSVVPDLAVKCDWTRFAGAKDRQWQKLFSKQPQFAERCPASCSAGDVDARGRVADGILDVYVCTKVSIGCEMAKRLSAALEQRGYSVHINSSGSFEPTEEKLLLSAKFFILLRVNGIFSDVEDPGDPIRLQIEKAIHTKKQIIVAATINGDWQYDGVLPSSILDIATEQVKNLDTGDLFEAKIDALVRESMLGTRGSLFKKYDIFISYRRSTGAQFARRVQQRLKELGYVVFLDYDSILNGKYDKVIQSAVDSAPVFLMLLTDHSLDRCVDPEDWVAAEIRMAHDKGKCIVPIMPSDQNWSCPQNLPSDMQWLIQENKHVILSDDDMFNDSLSKIEGFFPDALKTKISDVKGRLSGSENIFGQHSDCDWAGLLKDYPDLVDICPIADLGISDKAQILVAHPYLASKLGCSLDQFYPDTEIKATAYLESKLEKDSYDNFWANLLECHPEYAEKCDLARLNSKGWASLIIKRPGLANACDWRLVEIHDQMRVLQSRPEFMPKCSISEFDEQCWCELLEKQPQFADRCNWDEIEEFCGFGYVWIADMIIKQPQLAERIDWERAQKDKEDGGFFWAKVLSEKPELACYCQWELLYGQTNGSPWSDIDNAWADLLNAQPQFEKYCDWNKLTSEEWDAIVEKMPEMASRHVNIEKGRVILRNGDEKPEPVWPMRDLMELSRCEWEVLLKQRPEMKSRYLSIHSRIRVNKIHLDGSSKLDDFGIERMLADSFNRMIKNMFEVELKYSVWAPSRRLRIKGISFKGKNDGGVAGLAYRVANDLDDMYSHKMSLDPAEAEIIPGLLSESHRLVL